VYPRRTGISLRQSSARGSGGFAASTGNVPAVSATSWTAFGRAHTPHESAKSGAGVTARRVASCGPGSALSKPSKHSLAAHGGASVSTTGVSLRMTVAPWNGSSPTLRQEPTIAPRLRRGAPPPEDPAALRRGASPVVRPGLLGASPPFLLLRRRARHPGSSRRARDWRLPLASRRQGMVEI
jgi:hypothetical protein